MRSLLPFPSGPGRRRIATTTRTRLCRIARVSNQELQAARLSRWPIALVVPLLLLALQVSCQRSATKVSLPVACNLLSETDLIFAVGSSAPIPSKSSTPDHASGCVWKTQDATHYSVDLLVSTDRDRPPFAAFRTPGSLAVPGIGQEAYVLLDDTVDPPRTRLAARLDPYYIYLSIDAAAGGQETTLDAQIVGRMVGGQLRACCIR